MKRKESAINEVLDRRVLRRMAGAPSFERGEDYFANGQVGSVVEHEGTITAKVQGTRLYRVKLWVEAGSVARSGRGRSTGYRLAEWRMPFARGSR